VVDPRQDIAVSGLTHPSKPNWITSHAISTELSIAEVERLWLRFQQLGCNQDGILTSETLSTPKLSSDVFVKNILKYFKNKDGYVTFESFLKALKWSESQEINVKSRAIFQMLNNGQPIPKDMFKKILMRIYPNEPEKEIQRITDVFFKAVDVQRKGQLEESAFASAVMGLPRGATQHILNFHILPEKMRENVHQNLPEFSSEAGFATPIYESQVPSDAVLQEVAEKIHRKDWDMLANKLGFFSDDIDTIRDNNHGSSYQQAFAMLQHWKEREGPNAKASVLENTLRRTGMVEASLILAP